MVEITTENILGYAIATQPPRPCVARICDWLAHGAERKFFACANPHSLVLAQEDAAFRAALQAADLLTPDGAGIVLASKILGGTIRTRVTGSDIFAGLSAALNELGGHGYFFLGASEETLAAIKEKMAREYPRIRFAGSYSPPYQAEFSEEESLTMIARVNAARADVLWVGMTAPKQEKWLHRHQARLEVKFMGAIGAVFDFYGGKVKRSPPFFQKMGLEWLPRLVQEPRRLFGRNFVSSPLFLLALFRQLQGRGRKK